MFETSKDDLDLDLLPEIEKRCHYMILMIMIMIMIHFNLLLIQQKVDGPDA